MTTRRAHSTDGSVLIAVLVVCLGLVSVTLIFAHASMMNYRATQNDAAGRQAEQAIEGGARYAMYLIQNAETPGSMPERTSYTASELPVGESYFWILGRPQDGNTGTITDPQWGLVDEASKLNLNSATQEQLLLIPGMTQDLASAIVSWRGTAATSDSTGSTTSSSSSSSNSYSQRQPPYHEKAAPFDSIEELALVDGADPGLLTNQDANLNGLLDSYENDAKTSLTSMNTTTSTGPGLLEYLTVFSKEPVTVPGSTDKRIQVKGYTGSTGGAGGPTPGGAGGAGAGSDTSTSSGLTELLTKTFGDAQAAAIGAVFRTEPATSVIDFYMRSNLSADDFHQIENQLVTTLPTSGTSINGLVNVNTASREVLIAVGLTQEDADAVVSARQSSTAISGSNSSSTGITWLKGVLQKPAVDKVGPLLTGQTYVISADVAAVGRLGRGYRRTRFVFDSSTGTPKIVYRRNMSAAGWALGRQVRDLLAQQRGRP